MKFARLPSSISGMFHRPLSSSPQGSRLAQNYPPNLVRPPQVWANLAPKSSRNLGASDAENEHGWIFFAALLLPPRRRVFRLGAWEDSVEDNSSVKQSSASAHAECCTSASTPVLWIMMKAAASNWCGDEPNRMFNAPKGETELCKRWTWNRVTSEFGKLLTKLRESLYAHEIIIIIRDAREP